MRRTFVCGHGTGKSDGDSGKRLYPRGDLYAGSFFVPAEICTEKQPSRWTFILYAGALVLGLYDVSSNVYWVIPLCLGGGVYLLPFLLGRKQEETGFRRRLLQLVIASLAAALLTILLYGVIWLAIGSNLLVKDETGIYYGMSHVKMIFSAPFAALQRGMQYMLDTPYIQSEAGEGFLARLLEFFVVLAGSYLPSLKWPALILFVGGGAGLIALYIKKEAHLPFSDLSDLFCAGLSFDPVQTAILQGFYLWRGSAVPSFYGACRLCA